MRWLPVELALLQLTLLLCTQHLLAFLPELRTLFCIMAASSSSWNRNDPSNVRWAVVAACGSRGERWLDAAGTALCERRNPALQIVYLAILGTMYWMYSRDVFTMLPTRHVPAWHMCGPPRICAVHSDKAAVKQPAFKVRFAAGCDAHHHSHSGRAMQRWTSRLLHA